jgi:hypothetical protein
MHQRGYTTYWKQKAYRSLELIETLNIGPLVVVLASRVVHQDLSVLMILPRLAIWKLLTHEYAPESFFMPFSLQNLGMKLDVFVEIKCGGAFLKVFLNVFTSLLS